MLRPCRGKSNASISGLWRRSLGGSEASCLTSKAAAQRWIDSSISKTVNVPKDYPYEDFRDLYPEAWKSGLKGLATYRPNDVLGAVLSVKGMQGEWTRGFLLDRIWHLVLPVVCLSYGGFAGLAKLTRTSVLENLLSDYARTARAKGLAESAVLWRHVFRNSLLPLITVAASLLPSLLAGSVIVESIFSIEGMGKLAVEAVQTRDRELVLSITLVGGLLTLLGYLLADLLYALADPRVSYE